MSSMFVRAFPVEDMEIRASGDGRTVTAYATVFDTEVDISDRHGVYREVISPSAFDRTLAHHGTNFGVFYNHALTLAGTPSERGSMPIGTPLEVRADAKGLLTVVRYNRTALAEEALEAIRSGALTAMSFGGRFIASDPKPPRGGFRPGADGSLTTCTRTEIALREFGPTPMPAYADAAILGVRKACDCADAEPEGDRADTQTPDTTPPDEGPDRSHHLDPLGEHSRSIQWQTLRLAMRQKGVLL